MPITASRPRVALIDQMATEWQSIGRSPAAVRALAEVARRDRGLAVLVLGTDDGPPPCPYPCDVVDHMRRASGRVQREEAARLVRVLLREADVDPFICRMLVQLLVPGLVTVAGKLQWGRGGEWEDGEEFFGELLSTAWLVLRDWSGQDRPYAALDLLSAIRCRLRRQLFRSKEAGGRSVPLGPDEPDGGFTRSETDLEELARLPDRPAPGGDAIRRGPGPLRPPRPGLFDGRAGRTDGTRSPSALRPPGPGPAAPVRLTARCSRCGPCVWCARGGWRDRHHRGIAPRWLGAVPTGG